MCKRGTPYMLPCKESDSRLRHPLHLCVCVGVWPARGRTPRTLPKTMLPWVERAPRVDTPFICVCVCVCSRSDFLCLRVCILRPRGPNYLSRGRRAQGPRDPFPDHPHALVSTEAWREGARSCTPRTLQKGMSRNCNAS